MLGINRKLEELEERKEKIRVAIIGSGKMGRGLVSQMFSVKGMRPSLVIDRTIEKIIKAYTIAGVDKGDVVIAKTLSEINVALENNKFVACDDFQLASKADLIDVVVDATGNPEAGARIAIDSISNGKHIVALNVESDAVVGPILHRLAKSAGVVYTGTAGDEPGAAMELFDFADALGFEVLAIGKGKNNPIDLDANPTNVREQALKVGLKPRMLASFKDATNTMIEMTCLANATGLVPDIRGMHGPSSDTKGLPRIFSLKEEGGILNKYGVVDYVKGIAPGVFAIISSPKEQIRKDLEYASMGSGPNYILYRPYHLTSLETPLTIARAYIYNEPTIAPLGRQVAEAITVAKRDLKKGEKLDGIGEYTVYGSIETYDVAKKEGFVPIGLINKNAVAKQDIKKGQFITYDMVELDNSSLIYKLRKLQEDLIG